MNFDLDDLGDILSDGSTDSFFDTKTKSTKPATKPPPKPATPQKDRSKLKDLFDLVGDDTPSSAAPPVTPFQSQSSFQTQRSIEVPMLPKKETPTKKPDPPKIDKKDTAFDMDSDDVDLGFNLKNLKTKSGILDDILGIDTTRKKDPPVTVKPKQSLPISRPEPRESLLNTSKRPQTVDTPKTNIDGGGSSFGGYAPSIGRSSSGRRGSATKLNDPLGLFTSDSDPPKIAEKKKPSSDWLGLEQKEDSIKQTKTEIMGEQPKKIEVPLIKNEPPQEITMLIPSNLLSVSNRENENSLLELKRQESQLVLAAQVKNQGNVLYDMQKRQELLIAQQETQFNELLQKQLQRQQVIEENIKSQQQRISSHIQVLLSQQPVGTTTTYEDTQKNVEQKETHVSVEIEVELKRAELEKLRLEDLIANINVNHEQELTFLEKSYKKQIELLSGTISSLEQRMRNDIESLEIYYDRKIKVIEADRERDKQEHDKIMAASVEQYENSIKKLKLNHETEIVEICAKSPGYLLTLKNASKFLEDATGDLHNLRENIKDTLDQEQNERLKQIEAKEKALSQQQEKLEKAKMESNEEKTRLLELVTSLEIKLDSVTRMSSEEEWRFKQKMSTLEVERAGFDREKLFYREQLAMEQKNFEELKKFQTIDFEMKLKQIEEKQLSILAEKSKIETLSRVQKPQNPPELTRIEIEAAINVAQDAARQSDIERTRFLEMQRKYESHKRELIDKENDLRGKELELECSINSAKDKENSAQNMIRTAKLAENKIKAKLHYLKNLSSDLARRESAMAKEKLDISQERVDYQELRRKLYETRCSLCKISDKKTEFSNILTTEHVYPTSDIDIDKYDVDHLDQILDREVDRKMNEIKNYEFELNGIANITEMEGEILDPQLLLKWEAEMNRDF